MSLSREKRRRRDRRGPNRGQPAHDRPRGPGLGIRPWRILAWLVVLVVVSLAFSAIVEPADFGESLVLILLVGLLGLGLPQVVRVLRGTVSHEHLTVPSRWDDQPDGYRAAVPSLTFSFAGLVLTYAMLVLTGEPEGAEAVPAFAGGVAMFVFLGLGLCAGMFRRPRFLVPPGLRR